MMKDRKPLQDKIVYRPIPDLATFSVIFKEAADEFNKKHNKNKKNS